MKINKLKQKIKKTFGVDVNVQLTDRSIILTGTHTNWQQIVAIGKMFVGIERGKHVVNDIKLAGAVEKPPLTPNFSDKTLEGSSWDVVVIGGGVVGCAILRELSRLDLKILLLEKHSDLALGASGANDGMVHAGIDIKKKCKKLHYGVLGNSMFDKLCSDLDVPFKRIGQYVVFSSKLIKFLARTYLSRAKRHNIKGVKIIGKREIDKIEPTVKDFSVGAMYLPSTGCVSPYKLTIALAENAVQNSAQVSLNTYVSGFLLDDNKIAKIETNRGNFTAKVVVNAAGVFADKIAEFASDRYFSIHPRKGTDLLMDKNGVGLPQNNISLAPTLKTLKANKNTKGGGIVKTVDGNILLGPDAVETINREDSSTTISSVNTVFSKQSQCCPSMRKKDIIAYFSGTRACTYEEDFLIEQSSKVKNLIHVAGIQSPGLTAAPAIAVDVQKMTEELLTSLGVAVQSKAKFVEKRNETQSVLQLGDSQLDQLIKSDEDFGKVICRCEEITLGEIKQALNSPLVVPTINGVKRRTRAGMGRCQGGFCEPLVAKAISQFANIPIEKVEKGDSGSNVFFTNIQEVYKNNEN